MTLTRCITAAALAATLSCQKAETPDQAMARMAQEAAAARTAIEAQDARFAAFVAAGQADSIAMMYTADAVLMPANEPPVSGRDNIRQWMATLTGMGSWTLVPSTIEVVANGPHAVQRGSYTLSFTPGPNAPAGMAAMTDSAGAGGRAAAGAGHVRATVPWSRRRAGAAVAERSRSPPGPRDAIAGALRP